MPMLFEIAQWYYESLTEAQFQVWYSTAKTKSKQENLNAVENFLSLQNAITLKDMLHFHLLL